MTIEDKLNSVLNSFCAMSFKEPELCSRFRLPLNLLSEVINEVENLPLCAVSQQRELLEAYDSWQYENKELDCLDTVESVDMYLRSF